MTSRLFCSKRKGNCASFLLFLLFCWGIYFFFLKEKPFIPFFYAEDSSEIRQQVEPKESIRYVLAGIKSPKVAHYSYETDEPWGAEAKQLIDTAIKSGDITIEIAGSTPYLNYVYVWLTDPVESSDEAIQQYMLNALMLWNGYSKYDPQQITYGQKIDPIYEKVFLSLPKRAQDARRGIWSLPENSPEARKKEAEAERKRLEDEKKARIARAKEQNNVVITQKGKKYHRAYCQTIKGSYRTLHVKQALARGYKPCEVCNPPDDEVLPILEDFPVYGK